jgi:hypothetical protein
MRSFPAIDYAILARLRASARSRTADVICPACSATRTGAAARRKVLRTWAKQGASGFHCVRCDIHGLAFADNEEVEIARRVHIEDDNGEERKGRSNLEQADRIWRESFNITATAGETYFLRRGIALDEVPDFGGLRWHPKCPWEGGTAPCVLARFTDAVTAAPRGIWRRPIDGGKPKTLGPMRGCVIRLWRDCDVTNGLVIGEGVETVLAAATRFTHRNTLLRPAWAAGSAGTLEAFPVLAGIEALTVLVDHDAKGRGQEAARVCGKRWRDAGCEVTLLMPDALGADFNDLVRT